MSECDANGRWRPGAAMIEMQEAAGEHSTAMGCGRETLVKQDMGWVVVRMELQMDRYPVFGEEVTIRTYHRPGRHRFFPRYFIIRDGEGNEIGKGSSLWVLMDLTTRQSVAADRLPAQLTDNSDMPEALPLPGGIAALDAPAECFTLEPRYTELDANGHVNNTKYADWLCNTLGLETMTAHPPRTMNIHFNHEIQPGGRVELQLRRDGLRYQLTGIHEGVTAFEISGTLTENPEKR